MTSVRRTFAAAAGAVLFLASGQAGAEPSDVVAKVSYLTRFAPFVAWPTKAFSAADAPLVICAQAPESAITPGDTPVPGQKAAGHPVVVRQLAKVDAASGCQIAFIAGSPLQSSSQALRALDGAPVLTVTNTTNFQGVRGIVDLAVDGPSVHFVVDIRQADRNGILLSSKLLAVALMVKK